MVDSSDDAIVGETLDGIVTSWNRAAERMFGYSAAEMVGKPVAVLAAPGREDEMPRLLERIKSGDGIEHHETERRHKDGHLVTISLSVSPIFDDRGSLIGISPRVPRDQLFGIRPHGFKNALYNPLTTLLQLLNVSVLNNKAQG